MTTYAGKTIVGIAQERGSKSTTQAGAWKYLLAHLPGPQPRGNSTRYDWKIAAESRRNRTGDGRALMLGYDINDPNTPGRIWEQAWGENREWDGACRAEVRRDNYGALYLYKYAPPAPRPRPGVEELGAAWKLMEDATNNDLLPRGYDTIQLDRRGRSEGDALHQEMYDFAPQAALVCLRATEGTRYGVKTISKKYALIERRDEEIKISETLAPVAKLANNGAAIGTIIARIRGEAGGATLEMKPGIGYKALACVAGKLYSIYTGEEYKIGEEKREGARPEHKGGYYFYLTPEEARWAVVPEKSKHFNAPRVIAKCEVGGREVRYDSGKRARTSIKPLEVIQQTPPGLPAGDAAPGDQSRGPGGEQIIT